MTNTRRDLAVALGVALLAALPYLAAGVSGSFIHLDDPEYVTANPQVLRGLSAAGAGWALTTFHAGNWHPLTWLSHMLDVTLFGLDARGHHATSILLHAINAGLLFLVLERMTGAATRSALVAALFGVHPLRVESVAWVAERKDVLAGLFFMLALLAWERYARRGGRRRYWTAFALFAGGLAAKPMLVTFPFLLLLLDVWPLCRAPLPRGHWRVAAAAWRPILLEKLPFLVLAAASGVVTLLAQGAGGFLGEHSLAARLANAVLSSAIYLLATFWPSRLAVYYPLPPSTPIGAEIAAAVLLAAVSAVALRRRMAHPWLAIGWAWFLGMLLPVIGIVRVGAQARADRYAYLPQIGVLLATVWLAATGLPPAYRRVRSLVPAAGAALGALSLASTIQAGYWHDSETLFRRTLAVTRDNWFIHHNLAVVLAEKGRLEEAIWHGRETARIVPAFAEAHYSLGNFLAMAMSYEKAADEFREAIRIKPDHAEAHNALGRCLAALGRDDEALAPLREAVRIRPDLAEAHNNLGISLARVGRLREAADSFREATRVPPEFAEAHFNLGKALAALGRSGEAADSFRRALQIRPDFLQARVRLEALERSSGAGETQ